MRKRKETRENERKNEIVIKTVKKSEKRVDKGREYGYNVQATKKQNGGLAMSTFMAKPEEVKRGYYLLDAEGKTLGQVAVAAATILRGKHRPEFTPHVDCGEYVIVINAAKVVFTGKKLDQKIYYHHSGYIGGLKAITYRDLMRTQPEKAMERAVKGMLPKNTIGRKSITRLKVFAGAEHNHEAQKPVPYEF